MLSNDKNDTNRKITSVLYRVNILLQFRLQGRRKKIHTTVKYSLDVSIVIIKRNQLIDLISSAVETTDQDYIDKKFI